MRRTTLAATTTFLFLTVAACGGDEPETVTESGPHSAPTARATSASAASGSTSPAPEVTTTAPLKLGTSYTWEDAEAGVSGTSTAISYEQGIKSVGSAAESSGTPGYIWAALELKVCSTKGVFTANTFPWTLAYSDGARVEASGTTWDDFPKPEFPIETKLSPGKCVRGKVVYPVPGDSRPETIVYAPQTVTVPVEWAVPAT
ncbi:hypothetical protein GCM10010363_74500 [Streptomyces omiyaensis]|uniref:hypothetical protein n=1 Tax=Streptomyces omiyaensis TaxID=68247 RepID=UPI001676130E|nr:hypothetical protein [Streptomyces omiyaensis]GGY82966.1 hypothetical protein GCM10010363_74500 [Streptomyces omiyaensis]